MAFHRVTKFKCWICGCYWRRNDDSSWSLYDATQKPEECCDNNSDDFLENLVPVHDEDATYGGGT